MSSDPRPLLIGVSARIYTPGTAGINVSGIWAKNLHYLEQSVAHWVLSGHAMAVMIPAVTKDSIVTRSDIAALVDIAVKDVCHQTNPRPVSAADFERLFAAAL